MKILYIFCLLILNASASFCQDTTISASAFDNGSEHTISFVFKSERNDYGVLYDNRFQVKYKNQILFDSATVIESISAQRVNIDASDDNKEVLLTLSGYNDYNNYFYYTVINDKLRRVGRIEDAMSISTAKDIITSEHWMGFWTLKTRYRLVDNKLKFIDDDFYDVNQEAVVTQPFKIVANRKDDSKVIKTLKPGTKIKFLKADVSETCRNKEGYIDEFNCDWYLIQASDGTEGWVRLFWTTDKVEGLNWAG